MHPVYRLALLVCSSLAVVAEVLGIVMIDKLLQLMEMTSGPDRNDTPADESVPGQRPSLPVNQHLLLVFGILSIVYLLDIFLLIFSPDRIFTVYGLVLLGMSVMLWLLKRIITKGIKAIALVESTICLIILIDVVRTLLTQ
jgi:hypothetical protein